MNEINFDLENIIDGVKTYRGKNPKFIYSPKQINYQNSPLNRMMKYLNPNINKKHQNISNSTTNLKNQQVSSLNNIINKKEKIYMNERIFQKRILNGQFESSLFQKKLKLKTNNQNDFIYNNKIITAKPKIFNNMTYSKNVYLESNDHKISQNSIIEPKHNPLINKYNNKRSSSVMNANKANEKIKRLNSMTYIENYFAKTKRNEIDKTRISRNMNQKTFMSKNYDINNSNLYFKKNENVELEENHFKAVSYTQIIKNLNKKIN